MAYIKLLYTFIFSQEYLLFSLFLILFIISISFLINVIIIILLDQAYRPNTPQYPFNLILDRIIPIIALAIPTVLLFMYPSQIPWIERFTILLFIHSCVLIPIFHFWSKLRAWDAEKSVLPYSSWKHPRLYKLISIAIIYPLVWCIYFSLTRYIRLGETLDLTRILSSSYIDWIIIFIFIFITTYNIWGSLMLRNIKELRKFLWAQFSSLYYSLHLILIAFYPYFIICEKIYKCCYFVYACMSLNGPIYFRKHYIGPSIEEQIRTNDFESYQFTPIKYSLLRYIIDWIFWHPIFFNILFFSSLLIELVITKGSLYFGVYTLFLYPFIRGICSILWLFKFHTMWVCDVCLTDYAFRRWANPRYPVPFWELFEGAEDFYGFSWEFTEEEYIYLNSLASKYVWKLRKKTIRSIHHGKLEMRIWSHSFGIRLAGSYRKANHGVRWIHTSIRYMHTSLNRPIHGATGYFLTHWYDYIALNNISWSHYSIIQKATSNLKFPSNIFNPLFVKANNFIPRNYTEFQENSIGTNFRYLVENDVIIDRFNKQNVVFLSQTEPDTVFDLSKATFIDRRIHALDQKTTNPGLGKSKILSSITEARYSSTLDRFSQLPELSCLPQYSDIKLILDNLGTTYSNIDAHQKVWVSKLQLFPDHIIPPLHVPENFPTRELLPEVQNKILEANAKIKKISDLLYARRIPQPEKYSLPPKALDLFTDSEMQRILRE